MLIISNKLCKIIKKYLHLQTHIKISKKLYYENHASQPKNRTTHRLLSRRNQRTISQHQHRCPTNSPPIKPIHIRWLYHLFNRQRRGRSRNKRQELSFQQSHTDISTTTIVYQHPKKSNIPPQQTDYHHLARYDNEYAYPYRHRNHQPLPTQSHRRNQPTRIQPITTIFQPYQLHLSSKNQRISQRDYHLTALCYDIRNHQHSRYQNHAKPTEKRSTLRPLLSPIGKTLQNRTLRIVLCQQNGSNAQIPNHRHQAHHRQIHPRMDQQRHHHRNKNPTKNHR